ncbi:immunoglobulin domain-containing protein [Synoicihabitans lomoniglobus]|uniref:Immunoglobulin domain-containing protein n=1 Tax=Synoicihabitans lomoniglobus TaxID=2909285 RepID=A0AAF0I665_9BACT|nr:immunoglobulin domain-containing protein [Opitutaceae bacterium LMO-M01]WED67395.1 immunoglobulin domain-containing protein [Opitutaceae bacterium LMO-M01]
MPFLRLLLIFFGLSATAAFAQSAWRFTQPLPAPEQIRDIAANDHQIILAGEAGLIVSSTDGETWVRRQTGTRESFNEVHFLNGRWFATGHSGSIFNSNDGITWAQRTNLRGSGAMAYGNDVFVALTSDYEQSVRVSSDGDNWTSSHLRPGQNALGRGIVFAYGKFWAGSAIRAGLYHSTDGISWSFQPLSTANGNVARVVQANGRLFALVKYSSTSTMLFELEDGVSWVERGGSMVDFGYLDGRYYKRELNNLTLVSPNTLDWTLAPNIPATLDLSHLTRFQSTTFGIVSNLSKLIQSDDGLNWGPVGDQLTFTSTNGAARVGEEVLASNGWFTSDGESWQQGGFVPPSADYYFLCNVNARAYALVPQRFAEGQHVTELWVIDGVTTAHLAATLDVRLVDPNIWFANGYYFISSPDQGARILIRSEDGETWTRLAASLEAPEIDRIIGCDGDAIYIREAGNVGDVWRSTDGVNWSINLKSTHGARITSIAADSDNLIAGSDRGFYHKPIVGGSWSYYPGPALQELFFDGQSICAYARGFDGPYGALLNLTENLTWSADLAIPETYDTCFVTLPGRTIALVDHAVAVRDHDASLTLNRGLPSVIEAVIGQPMTISVTASSVEDDTLFYQWFADGLDIEGANSATLGLSYSVMDSAPSSIGVRVSDGTSIVHAESPFRLFEQAAPQFYPPAGDPLSVYFTRGAGETATVRLSANVLAAGNPTYTWSRNGIVIDTPNTRVLRLHVQPADAGDVYTVAVTNASGSISTSHTLVGPQPILSSDTYVTTTYNPYFETSNVVIEASADWATSFQWFCNGVAVPDANQAIFRNEQLSADQSGLYVLEARNGWGVARTDARFISVTGSRITNISVRAEAGTGENTLTPGVVIARLRGDLSPLVRAIGPSLTPFGIAAPLRDPALKAIDENGRVVASGDQWGGSPFMESLFTRVGAFPLDAASLDATVVASRLRYDGNISRFTAPVESVLGDVGDALVEVYDTGRTNDLDRLINLSCRARVSPAHPLIAGFVIDGEGPVKLLIRAGGSALKSFDIASYLANPRLTLFDADQREIGNNDTWHQAANITELRAAASLVGAFDFAEDSNDAASLVTLYPGVYTVMVEGVDAARGVALVELYEVP